MSYRKTCRELTRRQTFRFRVNVFLKRRLELHSRKLRRVRWQIHGFAGLIQWGKSRE